MPSPRVSVIIPNYNYADHLREAVDSVLSQTLAGVEVIVVDDGSKDASRTVIESYGGRIKAVFQNNQGVAAARNNGVAASSGELIAFLDADDVWEPQKLAMQVERFENERGLGLVHVGVTEIDSEGKTLRTRIAGGTDDAWRAMLLFQPGGILGGGSGVMVRRSVFDVVGGFDERLSTSADWDLYYRIAASHDVAFVPTPLLRYRIHGSNMHANVDAMRHDMLIAYQKAFSGAAPRVMAVRRKAYGALHQNLAGSYFRARNWPAFVRHSALSLANDPGNISYFIKRPRPAR